MNIQRSYEQDQASLYIVPTPIGNLEDMTLRAIRILKEVDLILAEDTRLTGLLLKHFDISTPMRSFHDHSQQSQVDKWADFIEAGHRLALVSDAGTPLINDPGHPLVQELLRRSLPVISLPGASAAITALVASGLPSHHFSYYGFFPRHRKDQDKLLKEIARRIETAIFYESPYRIKASIERIAEVIGPMTPVVIAREISKRFEEYQRGTCQELCLYLEEQAIKGECVLLVYSQGQLMDSGLEELRELSYRDQVEELMQRQNISSKEAIKQVAQLNQVKKQVVYAAYHLLDIEEGGSR